MTKRLSSIVRSINDSNRFVEERNDAKVSRSVLKSSGFREEITDFNNAVEGIE